jgi:hypothetical protein
MLLRKRTIKHDFSYDDKNEIQRENTFMIIFDKSYQVVVIFFQFVYKSIKIFINVSGIYLIWIFLHYLAAHLYVKLCVPRTIVGFLLSPFMTATPHCQGLRWVVYNAANMINNMWIILGAWICSILLINPPFTPLEKVEPN